MLGEIPAIKCDDSGKLTLLAVNSGYVMCRRSGYYPVIRTIKEWRALSDKTWGAEQ